MEVLHKRDDSRLTATYNAPTRKFITPTGRAFTSLSDMAVANHNDAGFINRHTANGWNECYYKNDAGEWVPTKTLMR